MVGEPLVESHQMDIQLKSRQKVLDREATPAGAAMGGLRLRAG